MIGRNSAPRPTPTKKNPLFQKCALIGWTGVAGLLIALLKFKRMDGLMMSSYKAPLCWDLHPHHYCDTLFPRKQHRSINYRQKKKQRWHFLIGKHNRMWHHFRLHHNWILRIPLPEEQHRKTTIGRKMLTLPVRPFLTLGGFVLLYLCPENAITDTKFVWVIITHDMKGGITPKKRWSSHQNR